MSQNRIRSIPNNTKTEAKTNKPANWKARATKWFWKALLYFFIGTIAWVVILKFVPVWFTPYMVSKKTEALIDGKPSKIYSDWSSMDELSKEAALAVISSEDQKFPEHWGFDFKAMNNALRYNMRGKKIRGASTISQQVAKNVFLWQDRSYIRKGLEVYFTFLIELIWGKKRILEVYLNVAETGPMTFGVEAAAQRFYGHSASSLSRTEAARIAAVLPSPVRFSVKNPSNYVQQRTNKIARQMRMLGYKHLETL